MKEYKGLSFERFTEGDVDVLTPVMKRAFDEDTRIHLGKECGGPPGYDDGSFLRQWALDKAATSYKISKDGKAIAGLILWINEKTKENFLGSIFVDSELENKGIGTVIWEFVESEYPDTRVWRTETPIFSHRNHNFYVNKLGFHVVHIDNPRDLDEGQFNLEKIMK